MARTIKRRHRPNRGTVAEQFGIMDLDAIYEQPDLHATEPIPPMPQDFEKAFYADSDDAPRVEVTRVEGAGVLPRWQVSVRSISALRPRQPLVQSGERISAHELRELADRAVPEPHRPHWLDVSYAPRIRPHVFNHLRIVRPPMHLMIRESLSYSYPWCTIGKVFVFRPGLPTKGSSGVLVGPNLLLAASHAMPWGNPAASIRFVPAYRNGEVDPRFGEAWVERFRGVPREPGTADEHDFALCKLDWRIGDRTGWMGSQAWSSEDPYYAGSWISVGFPEAFMGGAIPAVEAPVGVEDIDGSGDYIEIETDDFTSGGWSGGPLWGWINGPRVIGIASGLDWDWPDPERSVFAGGPALVALVKHGWAHWQ